MRTPVFAVPRNGVAGLVGALGDAVRSAGADVRFATSVGPLATVGDRWVVGAPGASEAFDHVVLAVPARAAGATLADAAPNASAALSAAETADVVMVTLHLPEAPWPDRLRGLSGYLVPKPVQRHVTAVSFGSQKWAHWRPPDGGHVLRVSVGRDSSPVLHLSDDQLLDAVCADLRVHLGFDPQPCEVRITRWPGAFAQYRPHHADWVASVTDAVPPGLHLAGAAFHGIGIPACIRSGRRAAAAVLADGRRDATGH
jgi:oxygen-dependent protoporphyrinogen oxidase